MLPDPTPRPTKKRPTIRRDRSGAIAIRREPAPKANADARITFFLPYLSINKPEIAAETSAPT
jgi:hypothetical protein